MGSKRLTPTTVVKMVSKCFFCCMFVYCCKSRLIEKNCSDKGPEKPGETVLQSNSGSQFFECTEFAETFAIPETSD